MNETRSAIGLGCLLGFLLLAPPPLHAQFNPADLEKSLVRITIKEGGETVSAATGFVWQKPNQVVTSLHLMRSGSGAKIIVEHKKMKRDARVKQVLPGADLVLLEVTEKPLPDWVPITSFEPNPPKFAAEMSALGYNAGAPGTTTRQLKKGYGNPEILKSILPPKDRADLEIAKIPDINMPIYYLEGSLLPGFSGAPVVDSRGRLVGVGNGGLENGASNVSWIIPATYLNALTASKQKSLPAQIAKANQSFSADLRSVKKYAEVEFNGYVFVKTKTRTFAQMLETTNDPEGLLDTASAFDQFVIDFKSFEYDIYEDLNFGLIIALPAGVELIVDRDGDLVANYEYEGPYEIQYRVMTSAELGMQGMQPEALLHRLADMYLEGLNEDEWDDYVEFEDARLIDVYGENRYVLRSAFNDFHNTQVDTKGIDYITFATNLETIFLSRGVMDRFDDQFLQRFSDAEGTDCTRHGLDANRQEICDEATKMLKILSSVHLTSFANAQKSKVAGN